VVGTVIVAPEGSEVGYEIRSFRWPIRINALGVMLTWMLCIGLGIAQLVNGNWGLGAFVTLIGLVFAVGGWALVHANVPLGMARSDALETFIIDIANDR